MYNYNAKCTRVVDGDTIDATIDLGFGVNIKKRIRLAGINAPESRTRNKVEKKLGLAAKDRLISMLEGAANCCGFVLILFVNNFPAFVAFVISPTPGIIAAAFIAAAFVCFF